MLRPYGEEMRKTMRVCTCKDVATESMPFPRTEPLTHQMRRQLDSGYDTDVSSPTQHVSSPTQHLMLMSDTEEADSDWFDNFRNMDLDNDVFVDNLVDESAGYTDYDSDSADREVEELLRHGHNQENSVSHNSAFNPCHRPSAPVPLSKRSETGTKCTCFTVPLSETKFSSTPVPCKIHNFRPAQARHKTERRILDHELSKSAFRTYSLDSKSNSGLLTHGKSNLFLPEAYNTLKVNPKSMLNGNSESTYSRPVY